MTAIVRTAMVRLPLLLAFYSHAASLIIPEELPTILSLIYSNIPPIKKGTDSRLGIGFRLGEHADFQVLIELGPQTETNPLGTADAKRRRDVMFSAAMKGELGPFAQAVAKYQLERRIQKEIEKLKEVEKKLKEIRPETKPEDQNAISSNWLTRWKQEISQSSEDNVPLSPIKNESDKVIQQSIEKPPDISGIQNDKLEKLTKLYKSQNVDSKKTST